MFELDHWKADDLRRFLVTRQEFFLDPMGSNRERLTEGATLLQRALFDWYLKPPGKFEGMLALVLAQVEAWSQLRKEERRTLDDRRFALNNAAADTPAVESSVSENQWQRIFGSLGLGLSDPGTFDRFLVQLDEETNPSLRINHRYLGELLPHDNMISYLSSMLATFLNENAIIGKASPCVTHMEEAAVHWLLSLVGWDGLMGMEQQGDQFPPQRLPTFLIPSHFHQRWPREEPTGTIVAGGTIANISALLIARNAVFDYLLGWDGAVQMLGPATAWEAVRVVWGYRRTVVLTSYGAHYSVKKSAAQAGVAPGNVLEICGSENPWILNQEALKAFLEDEAFQSKGNLVIAVVPIAGKTETGYFDDLAGIADLLNEKATEKHDWKELSSVALPEYPVVIERLRSKRDDLVKLVEEHLSDPKDAKEMIAIITDPGKEPASMADLLARCGKNEISKARHNRLFLHVDAAHGGGYLTVPALRHREFAGIELADTITIDGHKSFYCYYPCGGLLIRTTRWARTLAAGHSDYISEETNPDAYAESASFFAELRGAVTDEQERLVPPSVEVRQRKLWELAGIQAQVGRSIPAARSELTHHPYNQYLEGSRGAQGIMQLYFNLATLGMRGYRSILEWTHLLSKRCEEAISLGMTDLRLVTDPSIVGFLRATDKQFAIDSSNASEALPEKPESGLALPVGGGRFLRLSDGRCNQTLMTYIPAREAKLIAAMEKEYWSVERLTDTLAFLWRVNEHLWHEHVYANPNFTYYLGHTSLDLRVPQSGKELFPDKLVARFEEWNAWLRPTKKSNGFLCALATLVGQSKEKKRPKFFCHKIIVMHPYTDESLLGDMLRRVAFWGERSVADVRLADTIAQRLGSRSATPKPENPPPPLPPPKPAA